MSLPLPDLANKNYKVIIDEMTSSIPKYSSNWTNYNASDPGITILELLSWIAEMDLYRINNITKESYVNFLRLVAGASGDKVDKLLDILKQDPNSDRYHKKVLELLKKIEIESDPLFDWNEIPENNVKLKYFLYQHFGSDWIKTAKIKKIDGDKTISLFDEKNSLYLRINDEKNKVNLQINGIQSGDYIARIENNKLNIYFKPKEIHDIRKEAQDFLRSHYRAVTEEDFKRLAIEATKTDNNENALVKRVIVKGYASKGKVEIIIVLGPGYLFSWEEVPGDDSGRVLKFLKQEFNISWVETAKIEKIDNNRNIRVTAEKNYLSLGLNNEKTKVNLKIDDVRSAEFIAKSENGKLNIYLEPSNKDYEKVVKIVKAYFEPRKLIGTKIIVTKPNFTEIKIDVEVFSQIDSKSKKKEIEDVIKKKILDYLDPVSGYDRNGWPYGRKLTIFDIYHLIKDNEGSYLVNTVRFDKDANLKSKEIEGLISLSKADLTVKVDNL